MIETGGCMCRSIRYRFERESVIEVAHCHCTDCQKATGSGKATILFIPSETLQIEGVCKMYTVIGTEGSRVSRGFCENCGSPILTEVQEQPDVRFIKAGSLDDSSWVKPHTNYWVSSACGWSPVDSMLESHDRLPP